GHRAFECPHNYTHDKRQRRCSKSKSCEAEQVEDDRTSKFHQMLEKIDDQEDMIAPRKE
ncbi:hypothetical protein KI387_033404, partial [Taxus chinensis]